MKKSLGLLSVILISKLLIGCSEYGPIEFEDTVKNNMKQLSRVDAQKMNSDGSSSNLVMITDKDTVDLLKNIFAKIEWEQNAKTQMSIEDVKATLFFDLDDNMPARLFEYSIWFESSGATSITVKDENTYGQLDKEYAETLKEVLINDSTSFSPLPLTEIIAEEPLIIGHIVEINEEKQLIAIVEDITLKLWFDVLG